MFFQADDQQDKVSLDKKKNERNLIRMHGAFCLKNAEIC